MDYGNDHVDIQNSLKEIRPCVDIFRIVRSGDAISDLFANAILRPCLTP